MKFSNFSEKSRREKCLKRTGKVETVTFKGGKSEA